MEIHYFWVENFRNIKRQPITLSSRYIFRTEKKLFLSKGVKIFTFKFIEPVITIVIRSLYFKFPQIFDIAHIKITIIDNPEFIENFFDKPNIKNVSVIVGKNGAGKTSILNYILSTFPEGPFFFVELKALVIYTLQNSNELHILKPASWEVEIINKTNQSSSIKKYNDLGDNHLYHRSDLKDIEFFYYNYFLDYKPEIRNWAGIKNLSTSTLLCLPRKRAIEERWKDKIDPAEARAFDLDFFNRDEIFKAIQLLVSDKKSLIPFLRPEELYITISETDYIYFRDRKMKKETVEINSIVSQLFKQINNQKKEIKEILLNKLYIGLFLNFLVTHYYYTTPLLKVAGGFDFSFNSNYSIRDFVLSFFKRLQNSKIVIEEDKLELSPKGVEIFSFKFIDPVITTVIKKLYFEFSQLFDIAQASSFEDLGKLVPEFIEIVEKFVETQTFTFDPFATNLFILPLTEKTYSDFTEFINLYMKIKGLTNFLEFDWRGLSTGQQSFLSFMSRFYHEKKYAIGNDQMKDNLFIMIDEGDAGFHPEWKKQFFDKSLNFLSNLFINHNIQLVYTSNSPYILSDLPKNHITFIENKEDRINILEKDNSLKETFAQNIHTLLSDSFFLESGLIGDFAKEKINKAIRLINKEEHTHDEIAQIKNIIKIIGEPVIKQKLNQLFEDKFGFPVDIKQEIADLKKRLSKLRKIEGNDQNN